MTSFIPRVVLCPIRLFPTLISKNKWLVFGVPLILLTIKDMSTKNTRLNEIFRMIHSDLDGDYTIVHYALAAGCLITIFQPFVLVFHKKQS